MTLSTSAVVGPCKYLNLVVSPEWHLSYGLARKRSAHARSGLLNAFIDTVHIAQ